MVPTGNVLPEAGTQATVTPGQLSVPAGELNVKELMGFLKTKNFTEIRKWIANNLDNSPQDIFRKVYDGLYEFLDPASVPQAVVIIGEYQYKTAFVADQEINLCAFMVELMMNCGFKE